VSGLLIRGGDIVTAEKRWRGDIRCRGGRVVELGVALEPSSDEEAIEAGELMVLPGGVDPHVHMSLPVAGTVSSDDFETGTLAALAGGTTTLIDFVHPERGQDFFAALELRKQEAAIALADFAFHMAVTWWGDETAEWIRRCVEQEGIPSFKLYMAYRDVVGLGDDDIVRSLEAISALDALAIVHAEHGEVIEHLRDKLFAAGRVGPESHPRSRPPEAEGEATHRIATLAHLLDCPVYVVHVTCEPALEALRSAEAKGWPLSGETCPQYLLLEDSVYEKPDFEGAAYVIAPPLRTAHDQELLWRALADGTLRAVGTDHCPFNLVGQKELGREDFRKIPGGAAGVEHRLSLLHTYGVLRGRLDLRRFVQLVSTEPAKIFGLYPRKGTIAVGSDADLVLWDPTATATLSASTHHHRCDRSIYEGFEVTGLPVTVVANGRIRYHDGTIRAERGAGRYLKRSLTRQ